MPSSFNNDDVQTRKVDPQMSARQAILCAISAVKKYATSDSMAARRGVSKAVHVKA